MLDSAVPSRLPCFCSYPFAIVSVRSSDVPFPAVSSEIFLSTQQRQPIRAYPYMGELGFEASVGCYFIFSVLFHPFRVRSARTTHHPSRVWDRDRLSLGAECLSARRVRPSKTPPVDLRTSPTRHRLRFAYGTHGPVSLCVPDRWRSVFALLALWAAHCFWTLSGPAAAASSEGVVAKKLYDVRVKGDRVATVYRCWIGC